MNGLWKSTSYNHKTISQSPYEFVTFIMALTGAISGVVRLKVVKIYGLSVQDFLASFLSLLSLADIPTHFNRNS